MDPEADDPMLSCLYRGPLLLDPAADIPEEGGSCEADEEAPLGKESWLDEGCLELRSRSPRSLRRPSTPESIATMPGDGSEKRPGADHCLAERLDA